MGVCCCYCCLVACVRGYANGKETGVETQARLRQPRVDWRLSWIHAQTPSEVYAASRAHEPRVIAVHD